MTNDIRVGLVGFGHGGAIFHAPLVSATAGLRLTAILTTDPERRQAASRQFPTARLVERLEDMLDGAGRVDMLVIASPNRFHAAQARQGLQAGVAVVVDKPFAASAAEARAISTMAAERNGVLSVFQNRRWDGDFGTVRALRAEGRLGDVSRFESRFERWRPVPRRNWRELGGAEEAGGVLFDLGPHLIDQALQLFGPAAQVYAELDRRRPGVQVDDDAFVAIAHASGVRSHLWASLAAAHRGPRFRVLGSRAAYVKDGLDVQEDALRQGIRPGGADWGEEPADSWGTLVSNDETTRVPTQRGDYTRFYAGMVTSIRDGAPVPVDPRDAIDGLDVIEAARRSAAERRVVDVG
jgi:predicted dehydrogenase